MMNPRTVICAQTTPDFATHLAAVVHAQNGHLLWGSDSIEWAESLDRYFPHVALLDIDHEPRPQHLPESHLSDSAQSGSLNTQAKNRPWVTALRRVKLRPHTKYIPVIAFSQNDETALSIAGQLGADETRLYAALLEELPHLLQQYLDPPIRYIDGWDEALPTLAVQGLRHFNAGEFFEQHELLEDAWRAEERPIRELYQGILQIGVAFYQIELGNWKGAIKTFRRGLPKLRTLPPTSQGIELASFRATAEQLHAELTALGSENIAQFDQSRFPKIRYRVPRP